MSGLIWILYSRAGRSLDLMGDDFHSCRPMTIRGVRAPLSDARRDDCERGRFRGTTTLLCRSTAGEVK